MEEISPECCTLSHPLFLHYFLQNAFYWTEGQEDENLYALLEREFPSNAVWNRQLDQAKLSRSIPLTQCTTDGDSQNTDHFLEIQILFHQFYVEYRMDGQVLCTPSLPFWDSLLSDWESYYYAQAGEVPQVSFRMVFLPDYAVHRTPKKAVDALSAILSGVENGNGR